MVHDVAVVGGGPAGLAAAAAASGAGCRVALLDSGSRVGGQYWRHPPAGPDVDLHHDLPTFNRLAGALGEVDVLTGHEVWTVRRHESGPPGFVIRTTHRDGGTALPARCLVLAPGAYDRQVPFPGWDLPGVMTAGGVQALLKGHGVLAGRRIVVAGTGPFLLAVAAGLAARGAHVAGVFDANPRRRWLREPAAVARNAGKLAEAAAYTTTLARRRIKVRTGCAVIAAHGGAALEAVTVARLDRDWRMITGSQQRVAADVLAVGWGFTPQLELALALGCPTRVGPDGSLVVHVDDRQCAAQGVYVAGEATGVGGAALAVVEGEIAGRAVAAALDRSAPVPRTLIRRRARLRAFAAAMHRAHPVRDGWRSWLRADTVICRCEEVAWASVQDAVRTLGATDPRTAKLLTRTGMGWCQGRVCGYAVARLVAAEAGTPYDPHAFAERPVATPVRLGTLAADDEDEPSR